MARTKNTATKAKKTAKTTVDNTVVDSIPVKAASKTATAVSDSVVIALNSAHGIEFDISGNRKVRINGNAEGLRGKDKGHIPVGAFGLTVVKRADWEEVKKRYHKMRVFRSGLLVEATSKTEAEEEAEERKDTRNGLEPIDPNKDPQLRGRIAETSAPDAE